MSGLRRTLTMFALYGRVAVSYYQLLGVFLSLHVICLFSAVNKLQMATAHRWCQPSSMVSTMDPLRSLLNEEQMKCAKGRLLRSVTKVIRKSEFASLHWPYPGTVYSI